MSLVVQGGYRAVCGRSHTATAFINKVLERRSRSRAWNAARRATPFPVCRAARDGESSRALSAQFWSLLTGATARPPPQHGSNCRTSRRRASFGRAVHGPYTINEREVSPLFVYVSNSMWCVVQSVDDGVPSAIPVRSSGFLFYIDYST